ncbi:hypothetical protein C4587_01010 [Candidatus Parcubacteria bacterium]|nr:MAG: hypothetical protein C4587_01010 [Candidatus Parcubacteria bacterium]
MRQAPISFGTISSKGKVPQSGGARLKNAIVEQLEDGRLIYKRAPGLSRVIQSVSGAVHTRGMIMANDGTLLRVLDGRVESVTQSGTSFVSEDRGVLSGTDLVTLARNMAATPDVVGVSPSNGAFVLSATGAPGPYPDADVGSPNACCYVGSYFFFTYGDGKCRSSGVNTTAINALDVVTAEAYSDPLIRPVGHNGQLILFGTQSFEIWSLDQPNATGFPANRATVIKCGLASTNAVAGWEEGFVKELLWAGSDNIVYQLRGYEPVRVSTPTIERDLQALADKSELRAFVAMHNAHPYWFLKGPGFTHAYDLLTSTWQERESYGLMRFKAEQSVHAFGDWLLGDETTGDAFRLDGTAYRDSADSMIFEVESQTSDLFPQRKGCKRADFHFVNGTGVSGEDSTIETEPKVLIQWSDDGGTNWSLPLERSLGRTGEYDHRVTVKRCGHVGANGRKWRLRVSDPCFVGLFGGVMFIEN